MPHPDYAKAARKRLESRGKKPNKNDPRSKVGELARGKNVYPGGSAAHRGGPNIGRPPSGRKSVPAGFKNYGQFRRTQTPAGAKTMEQNGQRNPAKLIGPALKNQDQQNPAKLIGPAIKPSNFDSNLRGAFTSVQKALKSGDIPRGNSRDRRKFTKQMSNTFGSDFIQKAAARRLKNR